MGAGSSAAAPAVKQQPVTKKPVPAAAAYLQSDSVDAIQAVDKRTSLEHEKASLQGALQRSLLENDSIKGQLAAAHSRCERTCAELSETLELVEALKAKLHQEKKRRSSMVRLLTSQQQQASQQQESGGDE